MDVPSALPFILMTALIAAASPGPATLAIAATSMERGADAGLRLAAGVLTGSFIWSITAAAGLSALMLGHIRLVEVMRYAGAAYLFWLAFKSARAAWRGGSAEGLAARSRPYLRGLALHLTNPKAIFFFGALYSVILAPGQPVTTLVIVVLAVGAQSAVIFLGYALLFAGFGAKVLTARLS